MKNALCKKGFFLLFFLAISIGSFISTRPGYTFQSFARASQKDLHFYPAALPLPFLLNKKSCLF
jgi:hypothetical protein